MKFTREQVIEMSIEADGGFYSDHINIDAVSRLCTLAADRALEAAAVECDKYDSLRIDGAGETIRAMKEQA